MSLYIKMPGINELNSMHKTSLPEFKTVSPHPYKYIEYQQVFFVVVVVQSDDTNYVLHELTQCGITYVRIHCRPL